MQLQEKFQAAGQGGVFKYFAELDEQSQNALVAQLEQVDLAELDKLLNTLVFKAGTNEDTIDFAKLTPAPFFPLPEDKENDAVWAEAKCVVNTDKLQCDNCFRQCPTGAIQMVAKNPKNPRSLKIPVIDQSRCIGCGACENLCPARPISAIRVEGNSVHKQI